MATDSEFRTYGYIDRVLKDLGWDVRNPQKGGQVYYQGEFRNHDSVLTKALGEKHLKTPFLFLGTKDLFTGSYKPKALIKTLKKPVAKPKNISARYK